MASIECPHCGAPRTSNVCEFCRFDFAAGTKVSAASHGASRQAPAEVLEALRAGNLLEAIARYRRAHNCSLLEAKKAVEALRDSGAS